MRRFILVDYDAIPSGWDNQEKRNSRKHINVGVGRGQSGNRTELKTHHRKNIPTEYDEQGEITQTAGKAIFSVDWVDWTEETGDDEIIDAMIVDIATELQKTIQAVETKVAFTVIGNAQDCRDYIAANRAMWGEA